jgi:DNA helicase-2/ATP-dependent DNA helicase PcrA
MVKDPRFDPPGAREPAGGPHAGGTRPGSGVPTDDLNPEQDAAARHGEGPLLVIAGAGTGKTRTLVHRVAHLVARGVPPERILLLTFTRHAAQEMLRRTARLVGAAGARVHGGTFHGTAHRLLRAYGPSAGVGRDFGIMDQADAEDLIGIARAALGYGQRRSRFPKKETLHAVYSCHVNTETPVDDILRDEYPQFVEYHDDFGRVFADYVTRKAERNLVDYDDLLLFWAGMLAHVALGARIAGLYDHVLVDEYQDTNVLQARILRGMCTAHRNITVVGDDAQSIYAFRGANFRNILDFPHQFPGTTVVTLERNYRSTQPILDVTNLLISRAPERFTKNLRATRGGGERPWLVSAKDESAQTRFVVDRVLELHEAGTALHDMSVLFRAGYMSADLEIELTNRKIPFEKWGGLKFLESAHVKDMLAFLRLLENPRDEVSWYRALLLLPGVGDVTARGALEVLSAHGWDAGALRAWGPPKRARDAHSALAALLDALRDSAGEPGQGEARRVPSVEIHRIRAFYDGIVRERYDRPEPRLADLDQLEVIAAGYPSRASFLNELALDPPASTQDLAGPASREDDLLILSTAHSAKGCEWAAVFVIWAVDGWFPSARGLRSDEELDEERRLMYVAMTRARDHLHVVHPVTVYGSRWGADSTMDQLSRFVDTGVRGLMQRVAVSSGAPGSVIDDVPTTDPLLDVRAVQRGRFRGQ